MTTITIKCCFDSKFCARKTSLWYFTRSLSLCPHLASRSYRCARIRALPHCQFIGICRHQSKTTTTMDNDDNHKTTSILLSTSVECTWSNNTHHPHFLWKFCVFTAVLFQLRLLLLSLSLLIAHNIQMESILVWACVCAWAHSKNALLQLLAYHHHHSRSPLLPLSSSYILNIWHRCLRS